MAAKNALAEIRQDLETHVGEKVWIKANRGRRKTIIREGVLENTYPYHFLIKLDSQKHPVRVISISYADVLTQTVELSTGKPSSGMVSTD